MAELKRDVYKIVTDKVLELLAKGTVPWHKPWHTNTQAPVNYASKKPYRGINIWLLAAMGYKCPFWLSYKQVSDLGGQVTKGEHGSMVVYFQWIEPKNAKPTVGKDGKEKPADKIPLLRYYLVWNLEQTTLWADLKDKVMGSVPDNTFNPIQECEDVVANMPNPPSIQHIGQRACYSPALDAIRLPEQSEFDSPAEYYSTLFHELTHSTGHKSRLNRPTLVAPAAFGSEDYSKEELVAEMGAAFLCAHCHTENATINNSAAYLQGWMKKLTEEPKLLVSAAGMAQKATDHILNVKWEN